MSYNFLDKTGLAYFWQKIKAKIPTKTSQLTNDSGFLTTHQDITGKVDKKGVLNVLRYPATTGYLKFAECDLSYGGYGNKYIVLFVTTEYGTSTKVNNGLIFINIRGNGTNASTVSEFYWLMKNYQNNNDNSALCWAANDHKVEFYRKAYATTEYSQVSFKILHIGDFETASRWNFKLINVPFIAGTPLDTPIGNVTNITDNGYINRANVATKATQDSDGNAINTTYYKASNPNGYTSNTGTITGINMNGASKGTSGVVDLGTVITAHQDISGKQDKLTAGTGISISNDNVISATGSGSVDDVQVNGTSILSSGIANIITNSAYNSSSNKLATMTDLNNLLNVSGWTYASRSGTYTSSGSAMYVQIGKIVILHIQDLIISVQTPDNNAVLFTGLPKAKSQLYFTVSKYSAGTVGRLKITTDGTIATHYYSFARDTTYHFYGDVIYIAQ